MISKNEIKSITQLQQKKYRDARGLFVAEGPKVISELIEAGVALQAYYTTDASATHIPNASQISARDLQKISNLKTANSALAVFEIPKGTPFVPNGLVVALDAVRDPGNLGTIIRLCDWFGVTQLLCSKDTADCYNPKVVQATMGSIARIAIHYADLESTLKDIELPVLGAFMDGTNVYKTELPKEAVLVMGNEANGISNAIATLISEKISIPQFGASTTESLNVATATAILLSECKRSY